SRPDPDADPDPGPGADPHLDVADAMEDLQGDPDSAGAVRRLMGLVAGAARGAGAKAVATGQWMAPTLIDLAPRIPIRDRELLQRDHGGLSGAALAGELIRRSSRASAGVGAASGAMLGATQLVPPAWFTIPFELVVDTLAVAVIELKLVGELHEVYGRPVEGTPADRTVLLVRAWAERRGVTPATLTRRGGLADALGRSTRNELVRMVRRRLMVRMGRNLSTLAPLFAGAVAGAEVNRRATRSLGEAVVRDLAAVRVSAP
ncbi:MAG TPA: hypothetical protein VFO65_00335, partial [Acidimicrobiales bacterium]|nr:hypothetical protein [Acidimicrobiales bacterium]